MSFARKAAKSGLWFAAFRFATQSLSWLVTIFIARLLAPSDYGLMSMATILTGYIEIFTELGLGAAIIQKKEINQKELSSIFWFSLGVGIFFAIIAYALAYPTAWFFSEPRIIPLTQVTAALFIISALTIVSYNILTRDIRFKEIGMINLVSTAVSALFTVWMGVNGFGVWTLIGGVIALRTSNLVLIALKAKWMPSLYFELKLTKPLLKFGLNIAGNRSLFYIFQKSDRFIIGKIFNSQLLGYYSFAMQLASIPTDKIVAIMNQVSFPVFSHYQDNLEKIKTLYLQMTQYAALIVVPIFIGGIYLGDQLILVALGEKWLPSAPMFKMFCLMQLLFSITNINSIVHNTQGRPHWPLLFTLVSTMVMPLLIYLAARNGFNYVALPWITAYPLLCIGWTLITLKKIGITPREYLAPLMMPLLASGCMIGVIEALQFLLTSAKIAPLDFRIILVQEILAGAILYGAFLYYFQRKVLVELWNLRGK